MGDFDDKTWIESAREYERLRHRQRRFILGYAGPFAAFMVLPGVGSERLYPFLVFVFPLLLFSTCACVVGGFLTSIDLRDFPCPRCGRRFTTSWWISWPTDRCKHCGLDLASATKASKIPPSVADSWG